MTSRRLRRRPIAHRRRAFVLAATAVVTAAVGLREIASPPPVARRAALSAPAAPAAARQPAPPSTSPPAVARVARRLLGDYLGYLYGHRDPTGIRHASPILRRRLAGRPLRVSPATRARRPRIRRLTTTQTAVGDWRATATIVDGSHTTYPIAVDITHDRAGRLVVADVVGES